MRIAVTGHRPDKCGGYSNSAQLKLEEFAYYIIGQQPGVPEGIIQHHTGISGMALGWDQACVRAFVRHKIPFTAAVPFPEQPCMWPESAQKTYLYLISLASGYKLISTTSYEPAKKMQLRNQWVVDQLVCSEDRLIALWDGSRGGTFNCVKYAERQKVEVINVWPEWEAF